VPTEREYLVLRYNYQMGDFAWEGPYRAASARAAVERFTEGKANWANGPRIVKVVSSGELLEFHLQKNHIKEIEK